MLNLALDTATIWGRFALAEGDQVVAYRPLNVSGNYADALLPVVEEMLSGAGRHRTEVGAIGVTRGPGSFTGVRIGVATAKGLAYGLGLPLVAVSTLAAMAAALLAEDPERDLAVPVLDARRGELYGAVFRRRGAWVEPICPEAALPPDAWWARIRAEVTDLEAPAWGGEGVKLLLGQGESLRPEMRSVGLPVRRNWSAAHPATARALALAMADETAELPRIHPFALTPLYLRASDAEIKRRIDLTPRAPGTDLRIAPGPDRD